MALSNFLSPLKTPFQGLERKHDMKPWISGRHNRQHVSLTYACPALRCTATAVSGDRKPDGEVMVRRSGDHLPSPFSFEFLQSLSNEYSGEKYAGRAEELKAKVRVMLGREMQLLECVELVDNLERLGIAYLFEPQINSLLKNMFDRRKGSFETDDLYTAALTFRVLRHYGHHVPQEIFNPFMNENGEFHPSLGKDTKGMLALYDVSFLSMEGEMKLDLAKEFARKHLMMKTNQNTDQKYLSSLVQHSLEFPLAWRVPRIEARWYISAYETSPNKNPDILELSKLDFNIVQAAYQKELKHVSSWWEDKLGSEKLTFARERVVELFFWSLGTAWEPQYSTCRIVLSKVCWLLAVLDDLYDRYGTIQELELFTDAIDRWDVKAMDELPVYMKMIYLVMYNTVNDWAYDALKEQGVHIIKDLSKGWAVYCNVHMQQARWYHSECTPSVEEYLPNAAISTGIPVLSMHAYTVIDRIDMDVLKNSLDNHHPHNVVRCSALLCRLADDLEISTDEVKKGDVSKTLQCRMKQTGCSEEEAREYAMCLRNETWKKMIADSAKESPFSTQFLRMVQNMTILTTFMYENGDGFGAMANSEASELAMAVITAPIPVYLP